MKSVDFQNRKLSIIEKLIILNDEMIFSKIESLIDTSLPQANLKKLTKKDIQNRALQANKDIENNEVFNQSDVEEMFSNL